MKAALSYDQPFVISNKIAKYLAITKVNYLNKTTYISDLLSRTGLVIVRIWIFTQLYQATYAVNHTQTINGLTLPAIIWMLMFTQSFQSARRPSVSNIIDQDVKTGTLAYSINRPYSYALFLYFGVWGRILPTAIVSVLIGIVAAFILVGPISFSWQSILSAFVLLPLGYTLNFLIEFIIGLSSFWMEDIKAFQWIYGRSQQIFGGLILPLALFPASLRHIVDYLPFGQLYQSTARSLVHFDSHLFVFFLVAQIAWIAIFGLVAYLMFRQGVRNVSINGG